MEGVVAVLHTVRIDECGNKMSIRARLEAEKRVLWCHVRCEKNRDTRNDAPRLVSSSE